MATVREITAMCRAGNAAEAYNLAKSDIETRPNDIWAQRALGWALYYLIKGEADKGSFESMVAYIEELNALKQLTAACDNIMFDKVLFIITGFIKNKIPTSDICSSEKLSRFFSLLRGYSFSPSKSFSYFLQSVIRFDAWHELADFIDWWNLDKLSADDYTPYVTQQGRALMSLAERAHIAYSKAILKLKDKERITAYLPKLNALTTSHPDMMYAGYYNGKLLLESGSNRNEALNAILPFARQKSEDFWVWQLLSDVYRTNPEIQRACLLRAIHCRSKEDFLGKVRIALASLYIQDNQLDRAKYHIEKTAQCYAQNRWQLPGEIYNWIHQPWINIVQANPNDPLDYISITNDILCKGTEESVGIVTYIDKNTNRVSIVYGNKKKMVQKIKVKVSIGMALKINYIIDSNERAKILQAIQIEHFPEIEYAKAIVGAISKRPDKAFAFLKSNGESYFVSPPLVQKYNLQNSDKAKAVVVYDYDKKKDVWNWSCVSIQKLS